MVKKLDLHINEDRQKDLVLVLKMFLLLDLYILI